MTFTRLSPPWMLLPLLPGCGVMMPVDTAELARLDGKPKLQKSAKAETAPDRQSAAACAGDEAYEARLGELICEVETRRLELMRQAAEVSNNTANFNALTWPLGSATLYHKLSNPAHSLLLPAAVATGLYGFLNAGIPGRDATNRAAAKTLACGVVNASPYLYTTQEINRAGADGAGLRPSVWLLQQEINRYEVAARALLDTLAVIKPRPTTTDSISRVGSSSSGAAPAVKDGRPRLAQALDAQLVQARKTLSEGRLLLSKIRGSALKLNSVFVAAEAQRSSQLAKDTPALREPSAEATKISALFTQLAAQSGPQNADEVQATASTRGIPGAATDSLTPTSLTAWRAFQVKEAAALQSAAAEIERWLEAHQGRQPMVNEALLALGCETELPEPKRLPGKSSGSRPSTDATPLSGTPLSNAN